MQALNFYRILRFGVVGLSGLFIDFSITYFLKEKVSINKYVANATGFTCAVISNFYLNKYWTFNSVGSQLITNQFFLFAIISVMGLCINSSVIMLLIKKMNVRFYLSKVIAVCIVFGWNFLMNTYITFH
jgi:dolichol-phosphate mannosyltransferase